MIHTVHPTRSRGFTLVETVVAVVIASFVLATMWTSLGQFGKARTVSRARLNAYLRADAALNAIRRDVASVIRSDDLFFTLLRISDDTQRTAYGLMDRDEIILFNTRLRPAHTANEPEGIEYETQYRVRDEHTGPVLWQRRDAVPDEYYDGGGVVVPLIEGVSGINFEAFDGDQWWNDWNSDDFGIPFAIRIRITVPITNQIGEQPIVMSTVVSLDRVPPPFDAEQDTDQITSGEQGADPTDTGDGSDGSGGAAGTGDNSDGIPPGGASGQGNPTGGADNR